MWLSRPAWIGRNRTQPSKTSLPGGWGGTSGPNGILLWKEEAQYIIITGNTACITPCVTYAFTCYPEFIILRTCTRCKPSNYQSPWLWPFKFTIGHMWWRHLHLVILKGMTLCILTPMFLLVFNRNYGLTRLVSEIEGFEVWVTLK